MREGEAERRGQWGGEAGPARRRYRLAQEEAAAGGGAAIMSYSGEGRRRKMAAGAAPRGSRDAAGGCRGPRGHRAWSPRALRPGGPLGGDGRCRRRRPALSRPP